MTFILQESKTLPAWYEFLEKVEFLFFLTKVFLYYFPENTTNILKSVPNLFHCSTKTKNREVVLANPIW
jgi:hypothetical protein